jgi:hypothetical protein
MAYFNIDKFTVTEDGTRVACAKDLGIPLGQVHNTIGVANKDGSVAWFTLRSYTHQVFEYTGNFEKDGALTLFND